MTVLPYRLLPKIVATTILIMRPMVAAG